MGSHDRTSKAKVKNQAQEVSKRYGKWRGRWLGTKACKTRGGWWGRLCVCLDTRSGRLALCPSCSWRGAACRNQGALLPKRTHPLLCGEVCPAVAGVRQELDEALCS